jgi:hypothetical protein
MTGKELTDVFDGEAPERLKGFKIKKESIKTILSALQDVTKNVIVISGQVGGRGESYHTRDHSRLLTDMFAAFHTPETSQVTAHGEMWIQIIGRLNTIETFTMHGKRCPAIRLWANEAVHGVHKMMLTSVEDRKEIFRKTPCYEKGLSMQESIVISETPKGEKQYLRGTRFRLHKFMSGKREFEKDGRPELPTKRFKAREIDVTSFAGKNTREAPIKDSSQYFTTIDYKRPECHNDILTCRSECKDDAVYVEKTTGFQVCQRCYDEGIFELDRGEEYADVRFTKDDFFPDPKKP